MRYMHDTTILFTPPWRLTLVILVDFTATQRQYYDQLFKVADADVDGYIGVNDSAFFRKSALPNNVLGEVFFVTLYHVDDHFN